MYPFVGNTKIPMYGLLFFLGIVLAAGICLLAYRKQKSMSFIDFVVGSVFAVVGALIGAKLLFIFVSLDLIVKYELSFLQIMQSGFVFYGGLLGGAIGYFIYAKIYKLNILDFFDIVVVGLPLGQAIGRLGCFCAGCCYGAPTNSDFGVVFTNPLDANTPVGIKLYPTQLFESGYCFVIFVALISICFLHERKKGQLTYIYVTAYTICRFINEFFRGDLERGMFLGLSTSQIVSIFLFIVTQTFLFINLYRARKKNASYKDS